MNHDRTARALRRSSEITSAMYECWQRHNQGERITDILRDYPDPKRGTLHCERTVYRWVQQVEAALQAQRLIDTERSPWGITIAQGSDVRTAADGVPQGRVATHASSWDAERMRSAGVIDRYSRKK